MSAAAREDAERAVSRFLWLVDPRAEPMPDALDALLEADHTPAASLPVDGGGEPIEAAVGRFATSDPAALLEEARARRVPLRHTVVASLLVERRTVLELAPPDPMRFGRFAGNEWTARLFAAHPAVLVPASKVRIGALGRAGPLQTLRTARAAGWGRGETLRALYGSLRD